MDYHYLLEIVTDASQGLFREEVVAHVQAFEATGRVPGGISKRTGASILRKAVGVLLFVIKPPSREDNKIRDFIMRIINIIRDFELNVPSA